MPEPETITYIEVIWVSDHNLWAGIAKTSYHRTLTAVSVSEEKVRKILQRKFEKPHKKEPAL